MSATNIGNIPTSVKFQTFGETKPKDTLQLISNLVEHLGNCLPYFDIAPSCSKSLSDCTAVFSLAKISASLLDTTKDITSYVRGKYKKNFRKLVSTTGYTIADLAGSVKALSWSGIAVIKKTELVFASRVKNAVACVSLLLDTADSLAYIGKYKFSEKYPVTKLGALQKRYQEAVFNEKLWAVAKNVSAATLCVLGFAVTFTAVPVYAFTAVATVCVTSKLFSSFNKQEADFYKMKAAEYQS